MVSPQSGGSQSLVLGDSSRLTRHSFWGCSNFVPSPASGLSQTSLQLHVAFPGPWGGMGGVFTVARLRQSDVEAVHWLLHSPSGLAGWWC